MTDTHCHLDLQQFDIDRDAIVERARAAGVICILNPGVDLASSRRAVGLAERYTDVYAAVGFHPHDAAALGAAQLAELRALARHPRVRAIGEIGLDYYRNLSPRAAQHRAFQQQLDLAAELGLPVIIHCREALSDVITMLHRWQAGNAGVRGVMHSFSGDAAQAAAVTALGIMVGITGPVTFPKAADMRAVARETPLEQLLIETDAPYLTPAPYRGRRNEPAYVRYVAEKVAEVRGLTFETVAAQTTMNADSLFALGVTL